MKKIDNILILFLLLLIFGSFASFAQNDYGNEVVKYSLIGVNLIIFTFLLGSLQFKSRNSYVAIIIVVCLLFMLNVRVHFSDDFVVKSITGATGATGAYGFNIGSLFVVYLALVIQTVFKKNLPKNQLTDRIETIGWLSLLTAFAMFIWKLNFSYFFAILSSLILFPIYVKRLYSVFHIFKNTLKFAFLNFCLPLLLIGGLLGLSFKCSAQFFGIHEIYFTKYLFYFGFVIAVVIFL